MTAGARRRAARSLVLVLLPIALGACGRSGPPIAPELRLPAAVSALTGVVIPEGIQLAWTDPSHRVAGSPLRDLTVVRVFRTEDSGAGQPRSAFLDAGRIIGYAEIATIRLASPAPARVDGTRVTLIDAHNLAVGRRYTYVVIAADSTGRWSPPSPRLTVTDIAVPEPPRDLVATAGEGEVRLHWSSPARLSDGGAVSGALSYTVLRAAADGTPPSPVGELVETTEFVDRGVENDHTYYYAVRASRVEAGTTALGNATVPVPATPVKTTPPAPPTELVAIPSAGTVYLSWTSSVARDVARYVVYRAGASGPFTRVGSVVPPARTFTDRDVPSGAYRYAVTAQDTSARGNESARSNEATVSVP